MAQFTQICMTIVVSIVVHCSAESPVNLDTLLPEIIRQQINELSLIANSPRDANGLFQEALTNKLDVLPEVGIDLIVASLSDELQQDLAEELVQNGGETLALSEDLKTRLQNHVMDFSLQFVPDDLHDDVIPILEEYRATGEVLPINDVITQKVLDYTQTLEKEDGRNTRGFWSIFKKLIVIALKVLTVVLQM